MSAEELTKIAGPALVIFVVLLVLSGKAFGRRSEGYPVLGPPRVDRQKLPGTVVLLIIVIGLWLLGQYLGP